MTDTEFTQKLAECENAVKRFVYFKTPSKADGDDVLQETLLAAYTRREMLKNPDGFKAWLLTIASNKCNDFYRSRTKQPDALPDCETTLHNSLTQTRYGITIAETVQETLAAMEAKDAELLRLVYIDRYTQTEISAMLGVPVGTVKSRLHSAKQRFKDAHSYSPTQKPKQ